jgi:hypothetical protein
MNHSNAAVESVRKNMKREFRKSMETLQTEMRDYHLYKDNYDFMMFSPLVKKLQAELQFLDGRLEDAQYANHQLLRELKTMKKNEKRLNKKIEKLRRKRSDKNIDESIEEPAIVDNVETEEHIVYELVEADVESDAEEEEDEELSVGEELGEHIDPALGDMHMALIRVIDKTRMLDQDMIRLQQKVNVVLEYRAVQKIIEKAQKDKELSELKEKIHISQVETSKK